MLFGPYEILMRFHAFWAVINFLFEIACFFLRIFLRDLVKRFHAVKRFLAFLPL
jgi:hypothetical protein